MQLLNYSICTCLHIRPDLYHVWCRVKLHIITAKVKTCKKLNEKVPRVRNIEIHLIHIYNEQIHNTVKKNYMMQVDLLP